MCVRTYKSTYLLLLPRHTFAVTWPLRRLGRHEPEMALSGAIKIEAFLIPRSSSVTKPRRVHHPKPLSRYLSISFDFPLLFSIPLNFPVWNRIRRKKPFNSVFLFTQTGFSRARDLHFLFPGDLFPLSLSICDDIWWLFSGVPFNFRFWFQRYSGIRIVLWYFDSLCRCRNLN